RHPAASSLPCKTLMETARPTLPRASATPFSRAITAAPASRFTRKRSTRTRTTALSATGYQKTASCRPAHPKPLSRACRSPAITRCTPSLSMPKATSSSMSPPTNSCQAQNRMPNVSGDKPCTELETRAGIWRYDANKTDQKFSTTERYATGIRNADGIAMDSTGLGLYAAQQGRDELYENWPKLYNEDQGATPPAEELLQVAQGDDFGWPECYFDNDQQKLVLAPEYGGDGGKTVGVCAQKKGPVAFFPAHWAPNTSCSTTARNFPQLITEAPSSPFTAPGTGRPCRQPATTACSHTFPDGRRR